MSDQALDIPVEINSVVVLQEYETLTGEQFVTHTEHAGELDGEQRFARKPAITSLDRVYKANTYVDVPIVQMGESDDYDIITDVCLRWVVNNTSATNDTCLVMAPFHLQRVELRVSGNVIESYYPEHFFMNLRSCSEEQLRTYARMYGFGSSSTGWFSESVNPVDDQSERRNFGLGTGIAPYLNPTGGLLSRPIQGAPFTADSVLPGLATGASGQPPINSIDVMAVQAYPNGGFIARNSSREYILRMPSNPIWDGGFSIPQNREKIYLRCYFNVGTAVFDESAKSTYTAPANMTVHANANLLNMSELEAGIIGCKLRGESKKLLEDRHKTYNVVIKGTSPRWQNFNIGLPSASQLVSQVLTSLEGVFKNHIFFIRPTPIDGGAVQYQEYRTFNAQGQVSDLLPRNLFSLDRVSFLDSNGQSIWANQAPEGLIRDFMQLCNYGPIRSSEFNQLFEYVEFDWSALPNQGDDVVSRAGGFRVVHNNSKLQFYVNGSADLAAAGITSLELILLSWELCDYVQTPTRPDGSGGRLVKRTRTM